MKGFGNAVEVVHGRENGLFSSHESSRDLRRRGVWRCHLRTIGRDSTGTILFAMVSSEYLFSVKYVKLSPHSPDKRVSQASSSLLYTILSASTQLPKPLIVKSFNPSFWNTPEGSLSNYIKKHDDCLEEVVIRSYFDILNCLTHFHCQLC